MEDFYVRLYHCSLPEASGKPPVSNEELGTRLNSLLDTALKIAEARLGMEPKGTIVERCRHIESDGWTRIFREDVADLSRLSRFERSLADRAAEDAHRAMFHMRLVESFVVVSGKYVKESPTAERFGEILIILWDLVYRVLGKKTYPPIILGPMEVVITAGGPISITPKYEEYKKSRKSELLKLNAELYDSLKELAAGTGGGRN
jgi:hypothetical protein